MGHPIIKADNLTKLYKVGDSTVRALDGFDIEILRADSRQIHSILISINLPSPKS